MATLPRPLHALLVFLVALLIVLGVALLGVASVAHAYRDRYYPGVSLAGVSLGGHTRAEAQALLDARTQQYLAHPVKVVVPDVSHPLDGSPDRYADLELSTTAGKLGLSLSEQAGLEAAWQVGHAARWPSAWLAQVVPAVLAGERQSLAYQVDPSAIQTFVDTVVVPRIGAPVPAMLSVQGSAVNVTPPRAGFSIDRAALAKQLGESLQTASDNDTTYLKAPVSQVDSPITQQTVRPLADQLDAFGNLKLTLSDSQSTLRPNRTQLLSWLAPVQDQQGNLSLAIQQDQVAKYLASSTALDQAASLKDVMDRLPSLLDASMPASLTLPIVSKPKKVDPTPQPTSGFTLGKFEGKYIEVNLSQQRMYLINGSTLETSYPVSSGKASTPTPTGTFAIHGKSRRAYSTLYGLYMPWWQNFLNNEYGIHELPEWPNGYKEGEGHLGIPVSDGCIRLGIGPAEYVYNWTNDGTPVYIHF